MANGHISDGFADRIALAMLTRSLTPLPSSYFIGLTLALPTDGVGTGLLAPTPVEYGRLEVVAIGASWTTLGVGSRTMSLSLDLLWALAVTDWGQILGYTLYDDLTSVLEANYLGYGVLNPYTILAGMTPNILPDTITVALPY